MEFGVEGVTGGWVMGVDDFREPGLRRCGKNNIPVCFRVEVPVREKRSHRV